MAALPNLRVGLSLDSATFISETRKVNSSIESMGRTVATQTTLMQRGFTTAATAARSLVTGLGIGFGTAAISSIAGMAKAAINTADQLGEVAKQAGVSTTALQALQFQARQSGSSTEALNSGLLTFVRGVGQAQEGTGRLLSQLKKLDPVAAQQVQQARSQEQALSAVADAIERADGAAAKAAIAVAAFGGAGKELAVVFERGADEIAATAEKAKELGIILDTDLIKAANEVNDKLSLLFDQLYAKVVNTVGGIALSIAELSGLIEVEKFDALSKELAVVEQRMKALNELATEPAFESFLRNPLGFALGSQEKAAEDLARLAQRREEIIREMERESMRVTDVTSGQAPAFDDAADAASDYEKEITKLTGAQKRLADIGASYLTKTSAQEQRFDRRKEMTDKNLLALQKQAIDLERVAEQKQRLAKDRADEQAAEVKARQRELEAEAERQADLALEPWRNAIADAQSTLTDFFESALNGSITSFEDMADAFKRIFIRGIANAITTTLFNPSAMQSLFSQFGMGAAAAAAPGYPPGVVPGGGPISLSQPITGVPAGQQMGSQYGYTTSGVAGGAAFGAAGGYALGSTLFPRTTGTGGAIGGALGGAAGSYFGPGGTFVGATLGSISGSLIEQTFFGSGHPDKAKGRIFGGLGGVSFSGKRGNELQAVIQSFDEGVIQLLNARQRDAVNQALLKFSGTNINYKGSLEQGTIEHVTGERARVIARGLGFREQGIASGAVSQQTALANITSALQTRQAIKQLTGSPFALEIENLKNQFEDLNRKAKQFGISTAGLSEALRKAKDDLQKQQDAQVASLLEPFTALSAPLEAFKQQLSFQGLSPIAQFQRAQEEFARIRGLAEGGDLAAIGQLEAAGRALIEVATLVGASPGQVAALQEVTSAVNNALAAVAAAQKEASQGVEDILERNRKETDTNLKDLIEAVHELTRIVKKGQI